MMWNDFGLEDHGFLDALPNLTVGGEASPILRLSPEKGNGIYPRDCDQSLKIKFESEQP